MLLFVKNFYQLICTAVMKVQVQTTVLFILFISAWVDCTGVPSCATMRTWFPETNPLALADNLPYDLSVSGRYPGQSVPAYIPNSIHTGRF